MMTYADLTFELLLDWLEGRLSPEMTAEVQTLVATADAATQAQLNWLRAFESVRGSIRLTEPPAEVSATLKESFALYAQKKLERAQTPSFFQRIVAALRFDSALQPATNGLRAGENAQARQIVFATEHADIALHIQRRKQDQRVDLFGQVMPNVAESEPNDFCIQLVRNSAEAGIVMADEMGEFIFEAIDPGEYELILSNDGGEIVIPALTLKTDG